MNARGLLGFLLGLVVVGLLVGVGIGAYQAGVTQGIIDAGRFPAGATVPVAGYGWHGPGIFGLLVGLFFLFLLFGLLRAVFSRGGGSRGGWGPGGYRAGWGEPEGRGAEWHRRLHESEGGAEPGSAPPR